MDPVGAVPKHCRLTIASVAACLTPTPWGRPKSNARQRERAHGTIQTIDTSPYPQPFPSPTPSERERELAFPLSNGVGEGARG